MFETSFYEKFSLFYFKANLENCLVHSNCSCKVIRKTNVGKVCNLNRTENILLKVHAGSW